MKPLKHFCLTVVQMFNQLCLVPKTISNAIKQRRRQAALDQCEAERLDRICNPLKYRGK
jgi:hypothetical protein